MRRSDLEITTSGPPASRVSVKNRDSSASADGSTELSPLNLLSFARSNPDLAILAGLLLLTAIFGRSFSKLDLAGAPIYISEVTMVAAGAFALGRLGIGGAVSSVRASVPLIPLGIVLLAGAIATIRGITDYGLTQTLDDIGLAEYALILPLIALLTGDRDRHAAMLRVLVSCGVAGLLAFLIVYFAQRFTGDADVLVPVQGAAAGLYISLYVFWVGARLAWAQSVSKPAIALAAAGLVVMMGLTGQRSVWLIALFGLATIAVLAPPGRRLRSGLAVCLVLPLGMLGATGVSAGLIEIGATIETEAGNPQEGTEPAIVREISGLSGAPSEEGDNVSWRLAYWAELTRRTASGNPILGVGFGRPAAFRWDNRKYDFRDGEPGTGIDVAGPHNEFVNYLYRMGLPAALAFIALLVIAVVRTRPLLRDGGLTSSTRAGIAAIAAMLAGAIAVASFNEALQGPFMGLFFWIPLGLLLTAPVALGGDPSSGLRRSRSGLRRSR